MFNYVTEMEKISVLLKYCGHDKWPDLYKESKKYMTEAGTVAEPPMKTVKDKYIFSASKV